MSDRDTLIADVLDMTHDQQVTSAKVVDFIRRAEPKIERDLLGSTLGGTVPRQMLARADGTSSAESSFTLPADFLRARFITVGTHAMRYASPSQVPSNADGWADADVQLDYYQRLTPLTQLAPTNWVLADAYDVYLWGACLQYVPWGQENATFALWKTYYEDAVRTAKEGHQPQPRGAFRGNKDVGYQGHYTIIGSLMRFA